MKSKNFIRICLGLTIILLAGFASITVFIDPYFHYHKPVAFLEYPLNDQRYINDGIVKHFDYNAIITGTSMTENFKKTECDDIFGCKSVKVSFSGGYYKEVDQNIRRAIKANPDIDLIIRSLDYSMMYTKKDDALFEKDFYPDYLYNNNLFDDVKYVLNKELMLSKSVGVLQYTRAGNLTTTFDEYSNWNARFTFGKEPVLSTYIRKEKVDTVQQLDDEKVKTLQNNISQNFETTAENNPQITFYIFFPPYSICYWDELNQLGQVQYHIDTEKIIIEQLLKHENIKLFSFSNNFGLTCTLDNYKDQAHYGEWVNSQILKWLKDGEFQLTNDNYDEYLMQLEDFYLSYDYESIYASE